jgi:hypothetical protein
LSAARELKVNDFCDRKGMPIAELLPQRNKITSEVHYETYKKK